MHGEAIHNPQVDYEAKLELPPSHAKSYKPFVIIRETDLQMRLPPNDDKHDEHQQHSNHTANDAEDADVTGNGNWAYSRQ